MHERANPIVAKIYPDGMHHCITDGLREDVALRAGTATLQEKEHGLTESVLTQTDVLLWWGHAAHGEVEDALVERVLSRIWEGMGFIALHSAHYSPEGQKWIDSCPQIPIKEAREKLVAKSPRLHRDGEEGFR